MADNKQWDRSLGDSGQIGDVNWGGERHNADVISKVIQNNFMPCTQILQRRQAQSRVQIIFFAFFERAKADCDILHNRK